MLIQCWTQQFLIKKWLPRPKVPIIEPYRIRSDQNRNPAGSSSIRSDWVGISALGIWSDCIRIFRSNRSAEIEADSDRIRSVVFDLVRCSVNILSTCVRLYDSHLEVDILYESSHTESIKIVSSVMLCLFFHVFFVGIVAQKTRFLLLTYASKVWNLHQLVADLTVSMKI